MTNTQFNYHGDGNNPPLPMKYIHLRILRILSNYPRYRQDIQAIALSMAGHDIHNGTLCPSLQELERWKLVCRNNPDAPRTSGYQYSITSEGLNALKEFDAAEKQMALAPPAFT
jgi:DNA-binding PadR family transcriptional regulator